MIGQKRNDEIGSRGADYGRSDFGFQASKADVKSSTIGSNTFRLLMNAQLSGAKCAAVPTAFEIPALQTYVYQCYVVHPETKRCGFGKGSQALALARRDDDIAAAGGVCKLSRACRVARLIDALAGGNVIERIGAALSVFGGGIRATAASGLDRFAGDAATCLTLAKGLEVRALFRRS